MESDGNITENSKCMQVAFYNNNGNMYNLFFEQKKKKLRQTYWKKSLTMTSSLSKTIYSERRGDWVRIWEWRNKEYAIDVVDPAVPEPYGGSTILLMLIMHASAQLFEEKNSNILMFQSPQYAWSGFLLIELSLQTLR